jgi:hypothetical protein
MLNTRFPKLLTLFSLALLCALVSSLPALPVKGQVNSPSGMPDSAEFGYGGRVDPWGMQAELAVNVAAGIGFDWITIEFDWAQLWPDAAGVIDMTSLDSTFQLAGKYHLNVLLSLTHAPGWAMTENGPDQQKTSMLIALLESRYPGILQAVELFPTANTLQGWGVQPNPGNYAAFLAGVSESLKELPHPVTLIVGGLTPLSPQQMGDDMDDLKFLRALYATGIMQEFQIVSVRLTDIDGQPMDSAASQPRVLRHYEAVRQVMVENQHDSGLIWITGFAWPAELRTGPVSEQIRWLNQALLLMKSQLYIGAAFFDRVNPAQNGTSPTPTLVLTDTNANLHPALTTFGQIITLGRTGQDAGFQIFLSKKMITGPDKSGWKGNLP